MILLVFHIIEESNVQNILEDLFFKNALKKHVFMINITYKFYNKRNVKNEDNIMNKTVNYSRIDKEQRNAEDE